MILVEGHFVSYLPLCTRNEPVLIATCTPVAMPETRECVVQGATNIFTSVHNMDMTYVSLDPRWEKNNSFLFSHLVDNLSATVDTWWKCIHILIIDLQRQVVAVAQSWMAANRSLFIPPLATKKRSVPEPFGPCYKNIFKKKKKKLYNGLSVVLKKNIFLCSSAERCNERFSFFSLVVVVYVCTTPIDWSHSSHLAELS